MLRKTKHTRKKKRCTGAIRARQVYHFAALTEKRKTEKNNKEKK